MKQITCLPIKIIDLEIQTSMSMQRLKLRRNKLVFKKLRRSQDQLILIIQDKERKKKVYKGVIK
jgi:hypothetical protein